MRQEIVPLTQEKDQCDISGKPAEAEETKGKEQKLQRETLGRDCREEQCSEWVELEIRKILILKNEQKNAINVRD